MHNSKKLAKNMELSSVDGVTYLESAELGTLSPPPGESRLLDARE